MAFDARKYGMSRQAVLRDNRGAMIRVADGLRNSGYATAIFVGASASLWLNEWAFMFGDVIMLFGALYFWWLVKADRSLGFKLPMGSKFVDNNNKGPGQNGTAEGILYLGNTEYGDEMWFTNSDARTHVLYLGTTGSGKTEGLKSMVTNAMTWGSGFVYVDGKADTDLWSSLSALVRRFGRDDDLLVLNYMTGNADVSSGIASNTMNPFSSGSASYLTNMLVELMPDAEGDNAMWKERAVSLCSALMPIMTYKRDNMDVPLSVKTIRDALSLGAVVKYQRDDTVPEEIREGVKGYLDTLPGFVADGFDDNGEVRTDSGQDTTTASQQHGYLAMQFTRALQSLGDDYGYIFDTQAADVDMTDVVLNRRILVVLIPALEKSGDEIANLGKIVAATMKGMMGSTLGSTVEGTSATVIENKPTHSATPFMTVFDEVGYYTAAGMAVMAAQARSLGFCLIFSGQDLPAMKKRIREEANSITANCNIKIFGKLEDPTETKEFFEKTVGDEIVAEVSSFETQGGTMKSYYDAKSAGIQHRAIISYDEIRTFKEGEAAICFGAGKFKANIFYSNPGMARAMRVTRFLALPPPDDELMKHSESVTALRDLMVDKTWTARRADVDVETPREIQALVDGYKVARQVEDAAAIDAGISAIGHVYGLSTPLEAKVREIKVAAPVVEAAKAPVVEAKPDVKSAETAPVAVEKPAVVKRAVLPKEITDILQKAGQSAGQALFKGKGDVDAAE